MWFPFDTREMLSTVINGVCLALLDAGLAMNYLVSALSCCILNDTILLDPILTEESVCIFATKYWLMGIQGASATSTLVFSSNGSLLMSKTSGAIDQHTFFKLLDLSKNASMKILTFMRMATEKRAQKVYTINI